MCIATHGVWALPRSLATTRGIIVYFLFLGVLRCFSSPRLPPYIRKDNRPSACWVVPFGNPRINGYLLLPVAYRSLSRPSSPPRAKASTRRPNFLSPTSFPSSNGKEMLILSAVILRFINLLSLTLISLYLQSCVSICQRSLCCDRTSVGLGLTALTLRLSYAHYVENNGFEPLTPCLQSRCSSQLS